MNKPITFDQVEREIVASSIALNQKIHKELKKPLFVEQIKPIK